MIRVFEPWISFSNIVEVNKALFKNQISGSSIYVKKFEDEFKKFIGMEHSVAVSNGSDALDLSFQALNLTKDDEVILPSFSIISCLSSIIRSGAKPVFADVSIETSNITLDEIKRVRTKNTKAVLVVHTYGLPADIDQIKDYCTENSLTLIEDTAEAHGMMFEGKYCGSFGDISTFSFYANKHITSGEGGMIMTNSKKIFQTLQQMRNLDFNNERRFVHNKFYWNSRLSGLQAALAYSQIKNISKVIYKKQQQAAIYDSLLSQIKEISIPIKSYRGTENNYWVYGIVLKTPNLRDKLIENLYNNGVESRPFFWPLHLQPAYLNSNNAENIELINSEYLGKNGLYLPMGAHINKKIQKKIVNILEKNIEELINDDL
jgi:perosamine synthetase